VRNVPAALYKALGGFATNGVNMTKLESYMVDGEFAATRFAAETYGLEILAADIEDEPHNTTRFVVLSKSPQWTTPDPGRVVTSFVFRVRNVPAALYKALGGFATNGVNMTKLESYMVDGEFTATQFLADVEAHPQEPGLALALEELAFFCKELKILGVYPAHPYRLETQSRNGAR